MEQPVILSAVRTAIGKFLGGLTPLAATQLGAIAVKEALGLDWTQTIITIVIAWVAIFVVSAILGSVVAGFTFMSAF